MHANNMRVLLRKINILQKHQTLSTSRSFSLSSHHLQHKQPNPHLIKLNQATLYPYGVPTSEPEHSIFRDITWEALASSKERWGIVGPKSVEFVDSVILGRSRCDPVDARSWLATATTATSSSSSILSSKSLQVDDVVKKVSFKTRLSNVAVGGSGFTDYTSRYFGIREEDSKTLRQHLNETITTNTSTTSPSAEKSFTDDDIEQLTHKLGLSDLLDLPLITLSNGQTRRARIARALLMKPRILVLEEPFTGLDVASRTSISQLMFEMHSKLDPAIFLTLRPQDGIPNWVTHIVETNGTNMPTYMGQRSQWSPSLSFLNQASKKSYHHPNISASVGDESERQTLVKLDGVNVTYGNRKVLKNIRFHIKEGDRWALKGHNGSGKTTLLAVILGDHPFSYTEPVTLFGKPRNEMATYFLNKNVGHTSPELHNSFPRRFGPEGLTSREAIGTGFDHVFSYRKLTSEQDAKLDLLVNSFGHPALCRAGFLDTLFAELSTNEQALVLFLRALVKQPRLVILDEPFAGMNKETIKCCRKYLDEKINKDQALVIISHFEEELPDCINHVLCLDHGSVIENI